jgi:hypothetical protein
VVAFGIVVVTLDLNDNIRVVPAIVLVGVLIMLCVTRNSVSFMGIGE